MFDLVKLISKYLKAKFKPDLIHIRVLISIVHLDKFSLYHIHIKHVLAFEICCQSFLRLRDHVIKRFLSIGIRARLQNQVIYF